MSEDFHPKPHHGIVEPLFEALHHEHEHPPPPEKRRRWWLVVVVVGGAGVAWMLW